MKEFPKNDTLFNANSLDCMTVRYSASWMNSAQTTIHSDSRTGEILNASILINANMISVQYADRVGATVAIDPRVRTTVFPEDIQGELIEAAIAQAVGTGLGLTMNWGASCAYPVDSLRSPSFTRKYGTTYSIMDYARFNYVAQPEDKGVKLTPPNLGIYDEYVIKWLYTPLYGLSAKEEQAMLESWIDEHAGDPIYRYGKQQVIARYDPSALEEDLGDDAIKAGNYGIKNLKYIVANMNNWFVDDTDGSHRENLYN